MCRTQVTGGGTKQGDARKRQADVAGREGQGRGKKRQARRVDKVMKRHNMRKGRSRHFSRADTGRYFNLGASDTSSKRAREMKRPFSGGGGVGLGGERGARRQRVTHTWRCVANGGDDEEGMEGGWERGGGGGEEGRGESEWGGW